MNPKFADGTFQGIEGSEEALLRKHLCGLSGEGVEIGCCDGYSTVIILEASNLHLTSIDPLIKDSVEHTLRGDVNRLLRNTEPFPFRFTFLKDFSPPSSFSDYPLDFVFIDGDHSYDAVVRDIKYWAPRLKLGGLLAIHDCRMDRPGGAKFHEGPTQAANELIFNQPQWEVVGEAFSLAIFKKL